MESTSDMNWTSINQIVLDWTSSLNLQTAQAEGVLEQEYQFNSDVMSIEQPRVDNAESSSQISTPLMVEDEETEYICYGMVGKIRFTSMEIGS